MTSIDLSEAATSIERRTNRIATLCDAFDLNRKLQDQDRAKVFTEQLVTELRDALKNAVSLSVLVMQNIQEQQATLPVLETANVIAAIVKLEPVRQRAHKLVNHHCDATILQPQRDAEFNRVLARFRAEHGPPREEPDDGLQKAIE